MSCRLPPPKVKNKYKTIVSGKFMSLTTLLILIFLSLCSQTSVQTNFGPTDTSLFLPEDQNIVNKFSNPEIYDLQNRILSNQTELLIAGSSSGLYVLNTYSNKITLYNDFGLEDSTVQKIALHPTEEIYFLAGETGLSVLYPETRQSEAYTIENSELQSAKIADMVFVPEMNGLLFIHGEDLPGLGFLRLSDHTIKYYTEYIKLIPEQLFFKNIYYQAGYGVFLINTYDSNQIIMFDLVSHILTPKIFRFGELPDSKIVYSNFLSPKIPILLVTEDNNFLLWDIRESTLDIINSSSYQFMPQYGPITAASYVKNNNYDTYLLAFSNFQNNLGHYVYNSVLKYFNWENETFSSPLSIMESDEMIINSIEMVDEDYYIGTQTGLYIFDDESDTMSKINIGDGIINPMKIAYSSYSKGLYIADNNKVSKFNPSFCQNCGEYIVLDENIDPQITSLVAAEGKLFIGTFGSGLYIYDEITEEVTLKNHWNGLNYLEIVTMTYSNYLNELFIIAKDNTFIRYNLDTNAFSDSKVHFISEQILSITIKGYSTIYFSTENTVYSWDITTPSINTVLKFGTQIILKEIFYLNRSIYLGTNNGLFEYDTIEKTIDNWITSHEGLINNEITAVSGYQDMLFIGTDGGLTILRVGSLVSSSTNANYLLL